MQPERWLRIEEVFQSALDSAPENRAAILDAECGDDAELRREVESLLASHEESDPTKPDALHEALGVLQQHTLQVEGEKKFGAYRVLRTIGRGGMGSVYLAARADDAYQKLVAIKVILRGLDSDEIVSRFRSECRILATLDHPNITRLLDAGTTADGLPYFVMEYIEGRPIEEYCDARKLSITERLRLFQQVCSAVRYAHQNLVVHRDIKPGNVLVTDEGVPRLLDFGIAKILAPSNEARDQTLTRLHPFTPEYASPEQVRGEAITTASDVYSLGILLYQLLTGLRPYRLETVGAADLERAICNQDPERPSTVFLKEPPGQEGTSSRRTPESISQVREGAPDRLRRRLQGDLDNIVLMALRKEPQRRYASVEQFSEDIDRHLGNLPVMARPDTARYRSAKFVARHKAGVAAAALVLLTLTAGICATFWQAHAARQERDRARLEQAKAERVNAFLNDLVGFSSPLPSSPNRQKGHDATVADMLDEAANRVEVELNDQPEVKAVLLRTIGKTYTSQAKYALADKFLHEAYDLDLKVYGPAHPETARAMIAVGDLSYLKADYGEAGPWLDKGLAILRNQPKDSAFDFREFVGALSDDAFANRALGHPDVAESLWRESLIYGRELPAKFRAMGIVPKNFLAQLYMDRGDIQKAEPLAQEAADQLRAFGTDRYPLAQALIDLGYIRGLQGRYAEADSLISEGTGLFGQVMGEQHPTVAYGWLMAASVHYYEGVYDAEESDARTALKIVEQTMPKGTNPYSTSFIYLGLAMSHTGRAQQAEPLLRQALDMRQGKMPRQSNPLAIAEGALGECLMAQKRYTEAESLLKDSYETLKATQVPESPILMKAAQRCAALYRAWGRPSEAIQYISAQSHAP